MTEAADERRQARVLRTYLNEKGKSANGKHEKSCECIGCRTGLDCGYDARAKHLRKLKDLPETKRREDIAYFDVKSFKCTS